jgi:cellulose biosynthesis protein BcsQ
MEPGKITTFYSYKGGTGRTMALANIACLLAERDRCDRGILMIDWDLEAPGLHRFFTPKEIDVTAKGELDSSPGLIDFWIAFKAQLDANLGQDTGITLEEIQGLFQRVNFRKYIREINLKELGHRKSISKLFLMKAGAFDIDYPSRVSHFPWEKVFNASPRIYAVFAKELADLFDYVLIDSRTGITDTSGICTMIMPEKLVVVFTPNIQSLTGIPDLVNRAINYRQSSDDLRPLVVYPLPSRIENTEPTQKEQWRYGSSMDHIEGYQNQFEQLFKDVYGLDKLSLDLYFNNVQLQHIPAYSYGEKIAVLLENRQDRQSLASSYELFSNWLIDVDSPWNVTAIPTDDSEAVSLGAGAIAQKGEAVAIGSGGIIVGGDYNVVNISSTDNQKARLRYLQRLRRSCRALPLAVLGLDDALEEEINLDTVFVDLDVTHTNTMYTSDASQSSALSAIVATKRAVLLGAPGSGKSTILRRVIDLQAAILMGDISPIENFVPSLLPILINLRDFGSQLEQLNIGKLSREKQQESLLNVVKNQIISQLSYYGATDFSGSLIEALESGEVLLALDGLDEVPQGQTTHIKQAIAAIIRQYEVQRIVVTCRDHTYTGDVVLPDFDSFTIMQLSSKKIAEFVNAWYLARSQSGVIPKDQAPTYAKSLLTVVNSNDIKLLGSNPLLLTCVAIVHESSGMVPRERVTLYRLSVDVLLLRWQKSKTGERLADESRLNHAVERLAYESQRNLFQDKRKIGLSRRDILALLESEEYLGNIAAVSEFLDYADHRGGLIVGLGGESGKPESYQFVHGVLREYLAGCYLASSGKLLRTLYELAAEGDHWNQTVQLAFEELFYNRRNVNGLLDLAYQMGASFNSDEKSRHTLLWAGQIVTLVGTEAIENDVYPSGGKVYLDKLVSSLIDLQRHEVLTNSELAEATKIIKTIEHQSEQKDNLERFVESLEPSKDKLTQINETVASLRKNLLQHHSLGEFLDSVEIFGSINRNTAVDGISDVDAFVKFRGKAVQMSPRMLITLLKRVLDEMYTGCMISDDSIMHDTPSLTNQPQLSLLMKFPFGYLDLVPAIADTQENSTLIPDRRLEKWLASFHHLHNEYCNNKDLESNGNYKKVIKLIKWWFFYHNKKRKILGGFVIECLVDKYFDSRSKSLMDAFETILKRMQPDLKSPGGIRKVAVIGLPNTYKLTGINKEKALSILKSINSTLQNIHKADLQGSFREKQKTLQEVFGPDFGL